MGTAFRLFGLGASIGRVVGLAALLTCMGSVEAAKKKSNVAVPGNTQEVGKETLGATKAKDPAGASSSATFEELNYNRTLIIEGKVEKPAVQFTLLKEAPPEKEIRFETSFLQNILKLERENTFKAGETYGRE